MTARPRKSLLRAARARGRVPSAMTVAIPPPKAGGAFTTRLFSAGLLDVLPRGAKDVLHAAVALVARVLVDHAIDRDQRDLPGPRRGPGRRVLDREAVQQHARRQQREALRDLQVLVGGRHAAELL